MQTLKKSKDLIMTVAGVNKSTLLLKFPGASQYTTSEFIEEFLKKFTEFNGIIDINGTTCGVFKDSEICEIIPKEQKNLQITSADASLITQDYRMYIHIWI